MFAGRHGRGGVRGADGRGREAGGGPALHHREHLQSVLVRLADPARETGWLMFTLCIYYHYENE